MSTKASASSLVQAVKNLTFEWEETKAYWHDIKSQEFEKNYLQDLPSLATRATAVMEELDNLLKKVRSDCE